MRPPPRHTPTPQTPVLPGFVVSGDAKSARFELFVVSPEFHSILSMASASDPSVPKTTNRQNGESIQASSSFERVQIAPSVERPQCSPSAPGHAQQSHTFERVQMDGRSGQRNAAGSQTIEPPPSPVGEGITSPQSSTSFERVQLTVSRSDDTGSHRPTQSAFERVQTQPPSAQPPDTAGATPPFERVQMPPGRTQFPVTPRPGPLRRPTQMTPAHENPLRSTATPKEETPMSSTQ